MNHKIERAVKIPVANLIPNPWNPNKTTTRQQEAIAESLNLFSQVLEIIVRPHPTQENCYEIIDGEHRFQESKEFVYANIIHGLSDAEAKKLTIVLNETRGNADKIELAQLLTDIQLDLGDTFIEALPYTELELQELIKLSDVDWDSFADQVDEDNPGEDAEFIGTSDEFKSINIIVTPDEYQYLEDAFNLIQDQQKLNRNKNIAWGQVLVAIAKDYLATS